MTNAEYKERYGVEAYERKLTASRESRRKRLEREPDYRLTLNNQFKERYWNDIEFRNYHIALAKNYKKSDEQKLREKEYKMNDVNEYGIPKKNIRTRSYKILIYQRKHTKLKGYEIHHCFGYNDPSKFIYIPKNLHNTIHRFLKDNNINANTDHYKYIVDLINESTEYTYISA